MRPWYLGPLLVISRNRGGAYILAELDGLVFDRPVAAFRVIPYFAHRSLKLADLEALLNISQERLQAMEDSRSRDDDAEDDNTDEDTDTSSVRSAEDNDMASATSD
ncbi:hypothetical protein HETIRDRAFT_453475 [Heterobasidion irregulare TC 32-1]|uniref:Uncharacterized protein n=1 Tax=Heterobasidion irregulare (strain TC 32-1) TaxID=747525 RepID=W4JZF8_HETIT|nr:uncharacterized protein HETIRDRAFT_453475 [Heterobasidion irregulare TC 32-1]ETW78932.1 hypothetical protein HETIRDRAFT_453475 [Heterobasidion irregulare TC 32-1]